MGGPQFLCFLLPGHMFLEDGRTSWPLPCLPARALLLEIRPPLSSSQCAALLISKHLHFQGSTYSEFSRIRRINVQMSPVTAATFSGVGLMIISLRKGAVLMVSVCKLQTENPTQAPALCPRTPHQPQGCPSPPLVSARSIVGVPRDPDASLCALSLRCPPSQVKTHSRV